MSNFEFLEFIGQPALVLDESLTVLYANEYAKNRFETIANLDLDEGVSFYDVFKNSDYNAFGKELVDLILELNHLNQNLYTKRIDISFEFSMQLSFKKNVDPELGNLWFITGMNISKQVKENRKLQMRYKEQLDVFKILFDMAPVGLGIKDFEGGFYKVNQGLCNITGYAKEELLILPIDKLFPDYKKEKEELLIKDLIQKKNESFRQEKIIRTSSGDIKVVSETINVVKDEMEHPFLVIVSYLDITEERKLQRQLIESRKMEELGKLSGGLAHDFNNMLLPVTLCSDIALQEMQSMDLTEYPNLIRIQSYLEKISVAALRAKTLIQKLFQYSQSGVYELIPIQMDKEIRKTIEILKLQKPQNINIQLEIQNGEYPVLGESVWLEQILENLVVNSFHSMKFKKVGFVFIRLYNDSGDVILEVEDQGVGIEEDDLDKIFKPFYTNKSSQEGTGFGLIVVQTIVQKMSGRLIVNSKPGEGTLFQILFPKLNKN